MAGSNSLQVDYETRIAAPVDSVFPLACPVEEYKWIPGWKCDLVHCPNQQVEQGTVFDEYSSAPFLVGKAWALLQAAQPRNDRVADPVHDLTHHTATVVLLLRKPA
jgi:hypothetical protein